MEDNSGPGKSPEGSREVYKLVARDSEIHRDSQRPKIKIHENKPLRDKPSNGQDQGHLGLYHDKGSSEPCNFTKIDDSYNSPDDSTQNDSTKLSECPQTDSSKLTKSPLTDPPNLNTSPQTNSPNLNSSPQSHEDDSSDPLELHKLSLSYDYLIYKINDHVALLSETTHQSVLRKQELINNDYLQDQLQLAKEFKEIDEIMEKCRNLELEFLKLDQLGGFIGEFKERVTQLERVFKELG